MLVATAATSVTGFQVSGFRFQVSGFRFQVSGFRDVACKSRATGARAGFHWHRLSSGER
jgi:hypothetical protein